jgi:hypothetical protein
MSEQQLRARAKIWDDGAPLFLPRDDEGARAGERRGFVLQTAVCTNPSCDCGEVQLQLLPAAHTPSAPQPVPRGAAISLRYDLRQRAMTPAKEGEEHAALIEWLTERLGGGAHDWLDARYQRLRGQLADVKARARPNVDLHRGVLVAFDELLPHEWDLFVERDGKSYVLLDQYCLEPGCTCGQAAFTVLDLDQEEALGGARFDIETFKLQEVQGLALIDLLWARFLDSGGRETIRGRLKAAQATAQRLRAPPPRVGRNDPCPCGSGKKHKKCCGAAG